MISRISPCKLQQILITSVSGNGMSFMCKICQTVAGINITSQFHEFFESHFWREFRIWPNCESLKNQARLVSQQLHQPVNQTGGRVGPHSGRLFLKIVKKIKLVFSLLKTSFQSFFDFCSKCAGGFFVLCFASSKSKVEKVLKGSLDSIPSPSPSVKIQILEAESLLEVV